MKKLILTILFVIMNLPMSVSAKNFEFLENSNNAENTGKLDVIKLSVSSDTKFDEEKNFLKRSWTYIKGEPGDNAVDLMMFSYHTRKDRDQMNESNKLAAIDYNGYTVGTYNNSYHHQTYYGGIVRKVFHKDLPAGVNMDLNYKLLALYGYRQYEFNIGGVTPIIVPVIGFSKGLIGVDFLASPGKTVTFATNFRINLPDNKTDKKTVLIK